MRVISTKILNSRLLFSDPKIKHSLQYLSKFANFILIVINNKKIDKTEKDNVILRYYGIGAQIIKDLKIRNMITCNKNKKKINRS